MNSEQREIEDLQGEARLIRQALSHLKRQVAEWERMLMETQNKLFERLQQQRVNLERANGYQSTKRN